MHNSLTIPVAQPAGVTGAQPGHLNSHKPQNGCSQLTGNGHSWGTAANSGKANLAVITAHILESLVHQPRSDGHLSLNSYQPQGDHSIRHYNFIMFH